MSEATKEIKVVKSFEGKPKETDFALVDANTPKESDCKDNQLIVSPMYFSVDPYLRGRLSPNAPCVSGGIAKVVHSKSKDFVAGDKVYGFLQWKTLQIVDAKGFSKIQGAESEEKAEDVPLTAYLGPLGGTGKTAYYGIIDVAKLKPTDNVLISGAAGATGSMAGQIARVKGCPIVVGTAGSDEKIKMLKQEFSFNEAINYKTIGDDITKMQNELKKAFPKGIDVYFDNTGGTVTHAVWDLLNKDARVIICGQISMYNATSAIMEPHFLSKLIYKTVTVTGIYVMDCKDWSRFNADMTTWIKEKKIKYTETVTKGFENIPNAFIGLFEGTNKGKSFVQV